MKKMLSFEEVSRMIDIEFGYAQDEDIVRLLNLTGAPKKYRHLVEQRYLNRFFSYYAKDHGCDDYSDLIEISGGTSGTRYADRDIKKFLKDPGTIKRIEKELAKKTLRGPSGMIPKCIYHEYVEEISGAEDERIIELTGYTPHQVELFSVPNEMLISEKHRREEEINELRMQLEKKQIELDDVISELSTRGL